MLREGGLLLENTSSLLHLLQVMGYLVPRTTAHSVLGVKVPQGPETPRGSLRWNELQCRRLKEPGS